MVGMLSLWLGVLPVLVMGNLSLGPGNLSLQDVWTVFYEQFMNQASSNDLHKALVWQIRLPRILLSLLVGAALASSGVITQGLFRNPLASPNILGLSNGAAVAAIIGITFGMDEQELWATPLIAALGVLISLFFLYWLSKGWEGSTSLLLCGVALGTLYSAVITLLLSLNIKDYEISLKISQWLLGSFESRSWLHLIWGTIPIATGLVVAFTLRRDLDLLYLGTESANSLGVSLRTSYLSSILCVGLLVGTTTALVGIIGFVGLVIPHIARLLIGASHNYMLTFSLSLGACLMLIVDTISRNVNVMYLPPGAITSFIGAPLFLWLLRQQNSSLK